MADDGTNQGQAESDVVSVEFAQLMKAHQALDALHDEWLHFFRTVKVPEDIERTPSNEAVPAVIGDCIAACKGSLSQKAGRKGDASARLSQCFAEGDKRWKS
ncbi:MAG: hypothetical protein AAFQ63_08685 [Cyanobacteria bacterium J06621_11]